jgi:surface polysaccharide O-acyltransferase-like enzyme
MFILQESNPTKESLFNHSFKRKSLIISPILLMTSNKQVKTRNGNVELLRLLLMFMIVTLHYIVHGRGYAANGFANIHSSATYSIEMTLAVLCQLGVTGFMFISGYYGIQFKKSRLFSLWAQGVFYILALNAFLYIVGAPFFPTAIARSPLPFSSAGLWFYSAYFCVYMVSPILNKGIEGLGKKDFQWILGVLGFYLYVGSFLGKVVSTEFILLLYIYLLGRYFRIHGIAWITRYSGVICTVSISTLLVSTFVLATWNKLPPEYIFTNYNILILLSSVSLVLWTLKCKPRTLPTWLTILTSNVFAVYIITDYAPMRHFLISYFSIDQGTLDFAGMFLQIIVAMLGCLLIEEVRKRIFNNIRLS